MTAIATDRTIELEGSKYQDYEATGTIYKGTLVCVNGSGVLVDGTDTAGFVFAGISKEQKDSNNRVRVYKTGIFSFENDGSISQSTVNQDAWLVDNQTVSNYGGSTNKIRVGTIVGIENSKVQIDINVKAPTPSTHIADSGDSTVNAILDILEEQGLMKVV